MRLLLDLFRAADGRLEGVVHAPGAGSAAFTGVLDMLRVLEGLDLRPPTGPDPAGPVRADPVLKKPATKNRGDGDG